MIVVVKKQKSCGGIWRLIFLTLGATVKNIIAKSVLEKITKLQTMKICSYTVLLIHKFTNKGEAMAICKVCNHSQRKEIEKDIESGMKNVGRKWGISGKNISQHKYMHMCWNTSLIIKKTEFCEICLEKEECRYKKNLKKCSYWREYCEDIGRTA